MKNANSKSLKEYRIFLTVGVILMAVLFLFYKFYRPEVFVKFGDAPSAILSIIAAFFAEKMSQKKAEIKLIWMMPKIDKIIHFFAYFLIWLLFLFFSFSGLPEAPSLFIYIVQMMVVYMFAGAFFEIINILKTGAK